LSAVQARAHPNRIIASLLLATCTYGVSQTMLIPSLPEIERKLHASAVGATSLFSVFFVSGAVTSGIFGRLGDMFGKRRIILVQLLLFAVGALVCALGPGLAVLIVGRALMGSSVGVFPLSYSLLRDELPPAQVPMAIPLIGAVGAAGAAVGQATGGLVTDHLGYHWIFWIGLIGGVSAIAAISVFVPESEQTSPGRVDVLGAAILAAGLAAPLIAISQSPAWGWGSARTLGLFAAGLVILALFVLHERRHPDPLLHLPTLMLPRVRLTNLATFLVGFGLIGSSVIITQFAQVPRSTGFGLGASPTQAGLFLTPGLLLILVTSPLGGRISRRSGPKLTLVAGTAIGCAGMAGLAAVHGGKVELYLWPTIIYLGMGFSFAAMPLLILQAVPRELSGQSTSVNVILRNVGSSLGVQLAATFVSLSAKRTGLPTESGFTLAFGLLSAAAFAATLVGLAIPSVRGRRTAAPVEESAVAAGPT
jgi:MFS family permease